MHIAILPATPKAAQATIRAMLSQSKSDTIIGYYRDPTKAPEEFTSNPNFKAVKGDLNDPESINLTDVDAVLTITPPCYEDVDIVERARQVSQNTKAAVKRSSATVKRVVLLSSQGAEHEHGTGEIGTNRAAEAVLKDAAPEVVFVRCAYFMENWATALRTIKSERPFFYTTITPLDHTLPMVSIKDIGLTLAAQLLSARDKLPSSPYVFDLEGPDAYSSTDVQQAFEKACGHDIEVRPVERDELGEFYSHIFPPQLAKAFVEMNENILPGGILAGNWKPGRKLNVQRGETKLEMAIATLYHGK